MESHYTFCKKNGQIKHFYIPICEYIIQATIQEHRVLIGRYDNTIDEYKCYTTPRLKLSSSEQRSYKSKIDEICSNFMVDTKYWYGYKDLSVELHGENVEEMLMSLTQLLEVTNNIR